MTYTALATTLNGHSRQVARAYAGLGTAKARRATLAELRERIVQLTAERDDYRARWQAVKAELDAKSVAYDDLSRDMGVDKHNINRRLVGCASELARTWEVQPDRVCKWVKEGRVVPAGTDTKGRALYYLDTSKPAPKPRGKKAKGTS